MQVRIRKKNPLIERKKSEPMEDVTRADVPLDTTDRDTAEPRAESVAFASIYEDIEHTDRTEEIEVAKEHLSAILDEAPTEVPRPRDAALDDDETLVLGSKPSGPFIDEHTHDVVVHRDRNRKPVATDKVEGVVPRGKVGMGGTKGAGAAVRRQMIENADGALPPVRAPALKFVRAELDKHELASLDRALAGELDARATDGSMSPKRSLERLVNDREWNELIPKLRAKVLRPIAKDPGDLTTVKAAIALVKTAVVRHLPARDAELLLDVFANLGAEARAHLAQMAARRLRKRSVLEDRDVEDGGLVEHLHVMVTGKEFAGRVEAAGARRRKVANLVVGAIASPNRLSFEEGSDGVLSIIEFALAESSPAELLRLWRGLVSESLTAGLPGGGRLDLEPILEANPEFSGHQTPLRAALAALAELARPSAKQRRPTFTMPGGHGIDADVCSRALEKIYGVGFTVAAGAANAKRHLERVGKDPQRTPPVFVSLLYDRGERLFLFDHLDDEYVYLRAPHGRSTKRRGAFRLDPRREVVDPDHGIDRVARKIFTRRVGVALIPRT